MIGPYLDADENGQPCIQIAPGDPVSGGWCEPCMLPSLIRIPIFVLSPRGVSLWQVIEFCSEHGGHQHLPGKPELLRFPE